MELNQKMEFESKNEIWIKKWNLPGEVGFDDTDVGAHLRRRNTQARANTSGHGVARSDERVGSKVYI